MPPTTSYEPRPVGLGAPQQVAPFPIPGIRIDSAVPRFSNYRPPNSPDTAAPRPSAPKPTRRGTRRFFIGFMMLGICCFGVYCVWDAFLRYVAYGLVEGHVLELEPPWDGDVRELHIQEGDRVKKGQLLVTMENDELRKRLARLEEELSLGRATVTSEISRLESQSQLNQERHQKSVAEYFAAWGDLLAERTQLALASRRLERTKELAKRNVTSDEEVDIAYQTESGRRQKVEKIEMAVAELYRRAKIRAQDDRQQRLDQLEPHILRVDALEAEIVRCKETLEKGFVKSPVDGLVVKRHCFAGDVVHQQHPVVSIVEEKSIEIAVYVSQKAAGNLKLNDTIDIKVSPRVDTVQCRVCRIGHQFQPAPKSIERHYISNEQVLPIYLRPDPSVSDDPDLRLGAEAVIFRSLWPNAFAELVKTEARQ